MLSNVTILGVPYEVQYVTCTDGDLEGFYGIADHRRRIIKIKGGEGNDRAHMQTLLHEIIHCVNSILAVGKNGLTEQQVTFLDAGLFCVLMDNPQFLTELQNVMAGKTGLTSHCPGGNDGNSGRAVPA